MTATKSAFISYSWDDDTHKSWVRALAERLVANGVHVHLDQWDVQPGDSLTLFMDRNLPTADFVLVVTTPSYATKSLSRAGGVGYEAQIITAHIAAGIARSKFVPLIRSGSMSLGTNDCAVPPHFAGILAIDMRNDDDFDRKFEDLLRHIYGQPALQRPPLGSPPAFLGGDLISNATTTSVRLAHLEIEHWELESGVVMNELYPDTFEIPNDASRRNLQIGDFVKAAFKYSYPPGSDEEDGGGERMWIKITGTNGPYYIGTLSNDPVCTDTWHDLSFDSTIVFLPEHVISIDRGGEDAAQAEEHDQMVTSVIEGFIAEFSIEGADIDDVKFVLGSLGLVEIHLEFMTAAQA
ncbi:toll/interleukin-1 receptor domain-containing protein [Neorhizobium galegae]|nr:toll/interleukin-1 receptor domain-containing protein [Neorhizobium galegae]